MMSWQGVTSGSLGDPLAAAVDGGNLFAPANGPSKITWSLPEQIANALVDDIIKGALAPGQRLQEIAIAERFGVSRGPVREALRIVEKEGLAQIRPRYGAFVIKLSERNVSDIFEVRALLLGFAARRVAEAKTDAILAFLHEGRARLDDTVDDPEFFLPVVYRCTMFVVDHVDNDLARGILVSLSRQTLHLTRIALLREDNRRRWVAGWDDMVCAAVEGRPNGAKAAMRSITERVGASVLQVMRDAQLANGKGSAHA